MPIAETALKELVRDRKDFYATLHANIAENRALRFMEHTVTVPENYRSTTQVIKVPTIADMLLRVVSTLTGTGPTVTVPPAGPTDKAQRNSSLRERHAVSSLDRMQREVQRDVLRMGVDAACGDGLGVWKLTYLPDAWKDIPRRKRGEKPEDYLSRSESYRKGAPFPFMWQDVDPLCYFPVHDGTKLCEVLEISKRPLRAAARSFGVYRNAAGKFQKGDLGEPVPESEANSGSGTVECVEHWDGPWVTYMLDGEIVDQREVGYPQPPYFSFGGHMTASRTPEKAFLSVIEPFKHLVPALDRLLTMKTNWAYLAAWPLMEQNDPTINALLPNGAESVADIEPGRIVRGVNFMAPPPVGRDLNEMIETIRLMIDRSGLASVMYGQGASSSSGYMVNQLITAAQLVYKPILRNEEMALANMISFMWKIIEKRVAQPVYVWGTGEDGKARQWLGLGPDDIQGYYNVEVTLNPLLPMDDIAQRDSALRMVQGGLWPRRLALEKTGEHAPEEILDEIAVEKYLEDPVLNKKIMIDAAKRAGVYEEPQPQPSVPAFPAGAPMGAPAGIPGMEQFNANPILPPQPSVPGVTMPPIPPAPMMPRAHPVVPRRPGGPKR